jgi:hypothetical protein
MFNGGGNDIDRPFRLTLQMLYAVIYSLLLTRRVDDGFSLDRLRSGVEVAPPQSCARE